MYLLIGVVLFTFFNDAVTASLPSIVARGPLLRRISFPPLVIPIATTLTAAMTFAVNCVAVAIFIVASQIPPELSWLLLIPLVLELYLFAIGVALLVSSLYVRFRDVGHLWEVFASVLFFATPIMYPVSILPTWAQHIIAFNPLVQVIQDSRDLVLGPRRADDAAARRARQPSRPSRRPYGDRRVGRLGTAPGVVAIRRARLVNEYAIEAYGISKTFEIPHDPRGRLKEYFANPFRRTTYERNEALRDVHLAVQTGEFFGVIGPNGSGKSTLLKIIAGIFRADSGEVRIRGQLSPFIELGVGFNMELSARDNIQINGMLMGLTRRELAAKFDSILAFAELERFVDQQLKNYSSGMLLRLAYSIAIQVPFDILLLDEVLAVGDASFQEKCFASFEEMRRDGKTVMFVSHDLTAMERFCDRALLLDHGLPQGIGPTDEITSLYRDREPLPL